jgi:hypothetical protein
VNNDDGQETKDEENDDINDDDDDDDDGDILAGGAQMWRANEPRAHQASNKNTDGPFANPFNMDGFPNEHLVGGAYHGNCLSTPNDEGVCSVHGSKDYDMTFKVVMTKAMAMSAMEMMTRLSTTMVVVMRSMVLSMDKTTTFLKSLEKCLYKTGRIAIIQGNSMKTSIM